MTTIFELAARLQAANAAEEMLLMLAKATLILAIARLMLQRQFAELADEVGQSWAAPEIGAAPKLRQLILSGKIVNQAARMGE